MDVTADFKKIFIVLILIFMSLPAHAARKKYHAANYDFTTSGRYAGLVVNADTGEIIYQRNASRILHPASLTKMMTIYMAFKAIDEGKLTFNQKLHISTKAASQPKTNLRLTAGQTMTVREAILGLIVHSANDASVVLAEAIAGNEDAFAEKMTNISRSLGMKDTTFMNSHGLPNSEQVTSAVDMAKLAIALRRDYPQYYPLFSTKSFKFRGSIINSHNRVMHRYPWADGLKTGFIHASGFNLVTSANKHNTKLVGVVMGGHTAYARDTHMIELLEYGYGNLQKQKSNKPVLEVASQQQNYNNTPYKEGAFEVAYNDNADNEQAEEADFKDNDEVLGDLVSKGLNKNTKAPAKLDTMPLHSPKVKLPSRTKVTMVSNKKGGAKKVIGNNRYQKIIVLKNNKNKKSKAIQLASKSKKNKDKPESNRKSKTQKIIT